VASLGEILRRFRFHGVPGAPAAAAVPTDRVGEYEVELAPVFAALEVAQHRASDLVAAAAMEATRRRADAVEQGHRLVADARAGAGSARTEGARAILSRADGERISLLGAAALEADRITGVAAERTPTLVDHVVRWVLTLEGPRT